ncbi:MAG: class II fumarate hydratase [Verrucomicrobia bacterium]|nr:class II fumarate hydratase [Verrucomicrobiota bacterium]
MRTEIDSIGKVLVPDEALWGASTQRAVGNFPISGRPMPPAFIRGLGLVKLAAARANVELGRLSADKGRLIQEAAREIAAGHHGAQFPVDVFQTGSGTSTNTNANEVIAHRATHLAGAVVSNGLAVHPNDDVNLGQSSNDVIPTALHVSVAVALRQELGPALVALADALEAKSADFAGIVKIGRTHLMDATPLTLGQEFSGYARQVRKADQRVRRGIAALSELAVGGTAVGTGLNTHPEFAATVCRILSEETGIAFQEAPNHFEAQAARDDCVEVAGVLAAVAASLTKIANDLRLLASGPRAGFAELRLPSMQPGSSIMPGKVNPVLCEMMVQVGLYTQGLVQTVMACGREGQLELNATLPLIAHCLHESIHCLAAGARVFAEKCVAGLEADAARCHALMENSLMLVTALTPHLGYDVAASVAKEAFANGKTLREVVLGRALMDASALERALDPLAMTRPNAPPGTPLTKAEQVLENEGGHILAPEPGPAEARSRERGMLGGD